MQHPTLIPVTGNPFVCLSFNKKNSFEIENKLEQKLYYLYLTEEKINRWYSMVRITKTNTKTHSAHVFGYLFEFVFRENYTRKKE